MNKYASLASILTLIGSIIYLLIVAFILIKGIIGPIDSTMNGHTTHAYLSEFSQYPVELSIWVLVELGLFVFSVIGFILSRKVKKKAAIEYGIILIVIGVISLRTIAGTFFFISGILILLARDHGKEKKIPM